jgi:hypothetical protein
MIGPKAPVVRGPRLPVSRRITGRHARRLFMNNPRLTGRLGDLDDDGRSSPPTERVHGTGRHDVTSRGNLAGVKFGNTGGRCPRLGNVAVDIDVEPHRLLPDSDASNHDWATSVQRPSDARDERDVETGTAWRRGMRP